MNVTYGVRTSSNGNKQAFMDFDNEHTLVKELGLGEKLDEYVYLPSASKKYRLVTFDSTRVTFMAKKVSMRKTWKSLVEQGWEEA